MADTEHSEVGNGGNVVNGNEREERNMSNKGKLTSKFEVLYMLAYKVES